MDEVLFTIRHNSEDDDEGIDDDWILYITMKDDFVKEYRQSDMYPPSVCEALNGVGIYELMDGTFESPATTTEDEIRALVSRINHPAVKFTEDADFKAFMS